jgi:hypothetical protein
MKILEHIIESCLKVMTLAQSPPAIRGCNMMQQISKLHSHPGSVALGRPSGLVLVLALITQLKG